VQRRAFVPGIVQSLQDSIMQLCKLAVAAAAAILFPTVALSAEHGARVQLAQQDGAPVAKPFDVKNAFRNICGFCHEDYGRKEGKGPMLMNNPNSDEFLFNRIKNGKPGRMAAFGSAFTDDQIRQMVKFIRALEPGVQP
jgi:mono/diheme cytochrome c family protein